MRTKLIVAGFCLILVVPGWAQSLFMGQNQSAVALTGSQFTENWNSQNPAGACFGLVTGCRNPWKVGSGTAQSIAACPASFTQLQAGGNCLQMNEVKGTLGYIYTYGTFSRIPAATTADYFLYIDVTSTSIAAFDALPFFCISTDNGCGTFVARVQFAPLTLGQIQLEGIGATATARSAAMSLNAVHLVRLHVDATATKCSAWLDGTQIGTFTCNANAGSYLIVGSGTGNPDPVTYYVGRVWGNSASGGGFPPNAMIIPSSSAGATVTTTTLAADTYGGNGQWSSSGTSGTFTYSATDPSGFPIPVTINGVQHNTSAQAAWYFYDLTKGNQAFTLSFASPNPTSCSVKFPWGYSATDTTNFITMGNIVDSAGIDPFGFHFFSGQIYLNTSTGFIPVHPLPTTYVLSYRYNKGGTDYLTIYDSKGQTIVGTLSRPTTSGGNCGGVCIGRACGGDTGYSGTGGFYFGPIVIDYVQGRYPWF